MFLSKKEKNKKIIGIIISILIIFIGALFIYIDYENKVEEEKKNEILMESFFENEDNKSVNKEIVDDEIDIKEENDDKKENNIIISEDYMFVLEIPKINLKRGVFSKTSRNNNVNTNIQILEESNMPDEEKGNVILAGHSGNSYVSFFKNLEKLNNGDIAYIFYNGNKFSYRLVNCYEIEKTGFANIIRNQEKETLTLITCKHNSNKQYIFIFELEK